MEFLKEKLNDLIEYGWRANDSNDLWNWEIRVCQILKTGFDPKVSDEFGSLSADVYESFEDTRARQIGFLEGLILKESLGRQSDDVRANDMRLRDFETNYKTNKVFIVHGRDSEAKSTVARYLSLIGLDPIILHEQPSGGKTIIEKFEVYSDVGFAVILLTPDDVGGEDEKKINKRARQNVIMELGYFMGKLGRNRVCALYKEGVEIPSDYQGVVYVEYDQQGGWKVKLAQELSHCGYSINLEKMLSV
ncbi:hypothetical protein BI364_16455 [Acidihalobacter yilgarnensis]|uniref:CD-NTase-associated protein 12/Pycsar effector protein TIR domain-containing protein n=1 Tax=Acidihalobacter yilgarnensis TaxID=2819280 RepID=A0A1D8IRY9_9GAMM|nr:nucleotide-binding protein [Acidihalobacter yilgarnensis]AOU99308.1 hypothetical protein BI364_16455 [Acidihalobacter yilgarnensis]